MIGVTPLSGEWRISLSPDPQPVNQIPAGLIWEDRFCNVPSCWRWLLDPRFDYQPLDVFHYPLEWNAAKSAFLRRDFKVIPQRGERVWVTFDGVFQAWKCFVNGIPVVPLSATGFPESTRENRDIHLVTESFLPVTFDITDLVRYWNNDLTLWTGPWPRMETPAGSKLINPNGSWFAEASRGPWQGVKLEIIPQVCIHDIQIQTSCREARLSVSVFVNNYGNEPFQGSLEGGLFDRDSFARSLASKRVEIPAGASQRIDFCLEWQDAIFWSPENPYLYQLEMRLADLAGRIPLHTVREPFGFREVWFDGPSFFLNGVQTNLRGDAWHYQGLIYQSKEYAKNWFATLKKAGMNFVRLHAQPYPEFFLDAADEAGMLVIDESAIYGSSKATQSDAPEFLANCKAHLSRLVRRDRNHPSVILWSMQNEMRWVDGREGYRDGMPGLVEEIRSADPTRSILFDGDARLVPPDMCDALSLHYNIDGTIDGWDRQKPLLFGEHGAFHYVSPQVSADLGGQAAYLSFEDAIGSIGENERLFIEYARRQKVTGITPFNLVNYAHWMLPPDYRLSMATAGSDSLPRPNPAYWPLARACAPVTILAHELNRTFYAGQVQRSFTVLNDTEKPVRARLEWRLHSSAGTSQGGGEFLHAPGEGFEVKPVFTLQEGPCRLLFTLFHDERKVAEREFIYHAYSQERRPIHELDGVRTAFFGTPDWRDRLGEILPGLVSLDEISAPTLAGVQFLILGENLRVRAEKIGPVLDSFVKQGGRLLVLEQDELSFGELVLSGRKFFAAHPNPIQHPVFEGLQAADFRFWSSDNPHSDHWRGLVNNAFVKPVEGDFEILLECAEGNFGWGGLFWTPLVSYSAGKGRAVFCQVAIGSFYNSVPQAAILLRNLVRFTAIYPTQKESRFPLYLPKRANFNLAQLADGNATVIDWDALTPEALADLLVTVQNGATLLAPPLKEEDLPFLKLVAGPEAKMTPAHTYQLQVPPEEPPPGIANPLDEKRRLSLWKLFHGVSASDLYLLERVTYSPAATCRNEVLASYALDIPGAIPLLINVHNPWQEFFVDGKDGEWIKMSVASRCHDSSFQPLTYAAAFPVGAGVILFCQVLEPSSSDKVKRIYRHLLAALGVPLPCGLFTRPIQVRERGIPAWMGLPRQAHQDGPSMQAYFSSPAYTLNNLGEGPLGWMMRLEHEHGVTRVPNSKGQEWYLTTFIHSDINRDPTQRQSGELPDSSIVPDLWIAANCEVTLWLNGKMIMEHASTGPDGILIRDTVLQQGINRLALYCRAGQEDICLSVHFQDKTSDLLRGLRYFLTMD